MKVGDILLNAHDVKTEELRWAHDKPLLLRKLKIEQEKAELKKSKKQITTTKLLIGFLFISCTLIEIFTGFVTLKSLLLTMITGLAPDFTPLITLIGAIVSEVIGFAVYSLKSMRENTRGGIIYELAQRENTNSVG